jgi:PIN domain nuclease of toxin-antitoxin system
LRSFSVAWCEIGVGYPRPPLGRREPDRLPQEIRALLGEPGNELLFSAASMWEIAIKSRLGCGDFLVNARLLRRGVLDNDYEELPITSEHALSIDALPPIHGDPFDRILIAQATIEGIELLTADQVVAHYPGPIRMV